MIYTSYFSNYKKFPKDFELISIANSSPKNFIGKKEEAFVPPWSVVKGFKNGAFDEFTFNLAYINKLSKTFTKIKHYMEKDYIFLCWEGIGKFCHRHTFREFMNDWNLLSEKIIEL